MRKRKKEIEKVHGVFRDYIKKSPDVELLWSDKVGYVCLEIGLEPFYVASIERVNSAEELCQKLFRGNCNRCALFD